MKTTKKRSRKKSIIVSLVAVLVVSALLYFTISKDYFKQNSSPSTTNTQSESSSDTEKSRDESDKIIPKNSDQPPQTETDETTGQRIVPVVTSVSFDGSVVYIRGGINTPESDGSCYAELTGPNGEKLQKDTTLLPNANSTDCKTISIPTSELSAGQWSFTLNFSSSSAKGESSVATFTID